MTNFRAKPPVKDPEPEPLHEYSSLQLRITGRPAEIMHKLAMGVPDADLQPEEGASHAGPSANDGREHESHVTARLGLHFQTPSARMREALGNFGPITITLGKTSLFTGGDADVLKIDVDSPDLHRLYKLIGQLAPTHTTFPTYRPHATVAYIKKGRGKKYVGNTALVGTKMVFHAVEFSGKKGHKEIIPLAAPVTPPSPTFRARPLTAPASAMYHRS